MRPFATGMRMGNSHVSPEFPEHSKSRIHASLWELIPHTDLAHSSPTQTHLAQWAKSTYPTPPGAPRHVYTTQTALLHTLTEQKYHLRSGQFLQNNTVAVPNFTLICCHSIHFPRTPYSAPLCLDIRTQTRAA